MINSEITIYKNEKKLPKIIIENSIWPGMNDFLSFVENTDNFNNNNTKDLMNISHALQLSNISNSWQIVEI